ncbi:hypothetical protein HPB47_022220 [Ixodes persulcatus]|uniref:Uncharacterized protein n=1 Tax=Ixodes persulcatus TaxID=34615 RepID=A0AC60QAB3_IXOPE|nr:hypothetical protein HPB47_022220 [Ixodes persulcatus]
MLSRLRPIFWLKTSLTLRTRIGEERSTPLSLVEPQFGVQRIRRAVRFLPASRTGVAFSVVSIVGASVLVSFLIYNYLNKTADFSTYNPGKATRGGRADDQAILTCDDTDCRELARYVSESVQDTDPCENFYEYVCSNWSSNYTLDGVSPLVKVTIDPSDNTIKLDRPDTLFPYFTYVPNAHRSWYSDAVRLAARTPMPELFDFEQDLVASMYFPGIGESYVLVSAHDLTRNPEWDWQEFLANVFYGIQDVKHTTKVKLQPNQFGTKLIELLTNWRPAVVLNYLVFRLFLSYAPLMTSKRFRKLSEVTISSRPGWENKWGVNRSHACARMVARSEPGLVAFLLLSRHKQDQHEPMLRSVVEHGRREFVDFLGEISWITASFMEKLESRFRKLKIAFFMPPEWKKFPFRVSQCHSFKCAVADKPVIDIFQKMVAQRERRRLGSFNKPFPDYPSDIFETRVKLIGDTLIIPLALISTSFRNTRSELRCVDALGHRSRGAAAIDAPNVDPGESPEDDDARYSFHFRLSAGGGLVILLALLDYCYQFQYLNIGMLRQCRDHVQEVGTGWHSGSSDDPGTCGLSQWDRHVPTDPV